MTQDEMVGWHHWFNGHEPEQSPGNSEGQGSLACCSPWGHRVRHDFAPQQPPPPPPGKSLLCFLKEPNLRLQAKTNGFYSNAALDSRPSLGSPDGAMGAG